MSELIWLGIDPGLAILGWAILRETKSNRPLLIDYGIIETSKTLSTSRRLVEIEQDVVEVVREFSPHRIAIEMPYFNRKVKAAGGVMQALGVVNLVSYREVQIEPIFLHQSSWKCHLGNGRATKEEVAQIVSHLFGLEFLPIDDSVDAIAIAYAGLCGLTNNIK